TLNRTIPSATAPSRHQGASNSRPSTIPAQKNASHGNNGCVPFASTSMTSPTGVLAGSVSQSVVSPSSWRSSTYQRSANAASADPNPIAATAIDGSRHNPAATTNIAP